MILIQINPSKRYKEPSNISAVGTKEQPTFLEMSFQVSKCKSSSWAEPVASTGPSIWSRDLDTSQPPSGGSSSTKEKEKETGMDVLRQPCRELQMKRPREGDELTDRTPD